MFKKPLSNLKTSAPLRSSDRRKLRQRVIAAYNVSPEIGDVLVPEGLLSQKFTTNMNEQGVAYWSPDGDPLWFSLGKGADELIPTVYTLWKKYDLLPCITTPASVIPVLVGGADLMIPGVVQIPSSQTVVPPQLVAIAKYTSDSPTTRGPPLAIGVLAADLDKLKAGGKGKAVHLLHSWKDHLFAIGSKADPPGVVEIQETGERNEGKEGKTAETDVVEQDKPGAEVQEAEGTEEGNAGPPVESTPGHSVQQRRPAPQLSKEEVSTILRNAVLQAIHSTLKSLPTSSFPIPAGTFYSSHILPHRPAFVRRLVPETDNPPTASGDDGGTSEYPLIDIKHSTYKSLAAFLKILDKQGILTIKDMKPEPLVMSVSASHAEVLSHTPYVSLRDVQLKGEKREKREEEERARVHEMDIKELWKPHAASGSERFFSEGGFDSSAMYTHAELKATVIKYITDHQLTNAYDQSYVNVSQDEVLLSTLARKNESGESLEFLKREEVVQRLSEKMQNWYEIRAEGRDPLLRKGQLKPISVVAKTRQGRRANTLISGFESFLLEAEEMAEELRRICAGATGVSPLPGKPVRSEVLVQGKQTKAVVEFLLSRGVPKKWIETADLTGKK
ncbi:hypothetical protein M404DRAFT_1008652 [Pisolithus tinctorius Marx 270]|uniref:SUI1 domain-containing protein n=1 Tax=Pisolithus tinctorius Marx 270 TaxID=870435 RepID=A0A0C3MYI4_PISTI|nr:hypothetical protein M404DRAFT_1008652 [Pisolithus tinctorius Marx 270]